MKLLLVDDERELSEAVKRVLVLNRKPKCKQQQAKYSETMDTETQPIGTSSGSGGSDG